MKLRYLCLAAAPLVPLFVGGCASPAPASYQPVATRFYLESRPGEVASTVTLPRSGVAIPVNGGPVLLESDIAHVDLVQVDLGRCLLVQLKPAAARDLQRMAYAAAGRRLVLVVDGRPLGARRVDPSLADGNLMIFVELADERLPDLVRRLRQTPPTAFVG